MDHASTQTTREAAPTTDGSENLAAWGQLRPPGSRGGTSPAPHRPIFSRFLVLFLRCLGLLPLPAIHTLGGAAGWLASFLPLRAWYFAEINLGYAFPSLRRRQRRQLARQSLRHTGKTAFELAAVWTWPRQRLLDTIIQVSGAELVEEAFSHGRGMILAAPHLGPWELVLMFCSAHWPMTTLYRPLRVQELEPFVNQARERFGASMMPAGSRAVRALRKALSRGEMSAIAPDQDAGEGGGIFVPFFGVLANTMVFLPRLVKASGARVVMAYAERLPRGRGYHLHFLPPPEELYDPDLATAAAALNQGMERLIRRDPEQYMWCYDRYRIRPPGEQSLYPDRKRYW